MQLKYKTLFLDRDGVINRRYAFDYVLNWAGFEFCEGALSAFGALRQYFHRQIVVTNQQGVAKGLMSELDLADIHARMRAAIVENGGYIDAVYAATSLASPFNLERKPNIGMALQARRDFADIDFGHSVMIGDTLTDMAFGANIGARLVFVCTPLENTEEVRRRYPTAMLVNSLLEFSQRLQELC
jgi:D-glycero-D-manno-heptose 1,7-bisphosphate phosphatase